MNNDSVLSFSEDCLVVSAGISEIVSMALQDYVAGGQKGFRYGFSCKLFKSCYYGLHRCLIKTEFQTKTSLLEICAASLKR